MNKNITIERVKAAAMLQGHRLSDGQAIELIGIAEACHGDELKVQVNELREAMTKMLLIADENRDDRTTVYDVFSITTEALSKTTEQPLADYRASVIDEAAIRICNVSGVTFMGVFSIALEEAVEALEAMK